MPLDLLTTILSHASSRGDRVALQIKRDGSYAKTTYERLRERARAVAAWLAARGVRPGDRVALFSENGPEWVAGYLGILASGATVVPLDAQYTARELTPVLSFARVDAILVSRALHDKVVAPLAAARPFRAILLLDGADGETLDALPPARADFTPPARPADAVASVIFTSGTTGDPKGVVLLDRNFAANVEGVLPLGLVRPDDNTLSVLPLHHCYAFLATVLLPLVQGATVTFLATLKGPDLLAAMNETGVTQMAGVPQLFVMLERALFAKIEKSPPAARRLFKALFSFSEFVHDRLGLPAGRLLFRKVRSAFGPRFRFFTSGGAKLDPRVWKSFATLGIEILEGYGLTETAPVIAFNPPGGARLGSCGKPLPNVEVKIANPDAQGTGEIAMRGPNLMAGYLEKPEATAEVVRDGWFHTGDLGHLDRDGYLFITGRAKELIVMASGKKIYPEEVEKHYAGCPYVTELCVLGSGGGPSGAEKLAAIVVPNYRLLREQNIANCAHAIKTSFEELSLKVPTYQRIVDVRIVSEELPRTRLGKLKRAEIARRGLLDRADDDAVKKPDLTPEEAALLAEPLAARLVGRIKALTGRREVSPRDNLELDLGVDSLTRLELMVALEHEFGVKVPKEEASSLLRVADLLDLVVRLGKEGGGTEGLLAALRAEPEIPLERAFILRPWLPGAFVRFVMKRLCALFFRATCGVTVRGLEKLPARGPVLLCPNHTSYIDPVLVFAFLPDRITRFSFFIALEEMFGGLLFRPFVRLFRLILTGTEETMIRSLQYSSRALAQGMTICVFPEGQRTIDETVVPPKKGFALLALEHGVPVYPIHLGGALAMWSKPNPGFRAHPLTITIGDPLRPPAERFSEKAADALMKAWHERLREMQRAAREAGAAS